MSQITTSVHTHNTTNSRQWTLYTL